MTIKKIILPSILIACFIALVFSSIANASGWMGEGEANMGNDSDYNPSGGGGGGSGCTEKDGALCSGWSWIYYKFVGTPTDKNNLKNLNFQFTPEINKGNPRLNSDWSYAVGVYQIGDSTENCADYGGFWHRGENYTTNVELPKHPGYYLWSSEYTASKEYGRMSDLSFLIFPGITNYGTHANINDAWRASHNYLINANSTNGRYAYSIGAKHLGHYKTAVGAKANLANQKTVNNTSLINTSATGNDEKAHTLYYRMPSSSFVGQWPGPHDDYGWRQAYRATMSLPESAGTNSDEDVFKYFSDTYKRITGNDYDDPDDTERIPDKYYGFCSSDPNETKKQANFEGETTIYTDNNYTGSNNKYNKSSYNIKINHKITRVSGEEFQAANNYETHPTMGVGKESSGNTQKPKATITTSDSVKSGTINPGQTVSFCSYLTFDNIVYSNGTAEHNGKTNQQCVTITRPPILYSGSITANVKAKNNGGSFENMSVSATNNTITLTDSYNGEYEIKFTGNIKRTGDEAGQTYATSYWAKADDNYTEKEGNSSLTWSEEKTNALENGKSQNVFTVKYTGSLNYGESVKKCTNLEYINKQASGGQRTKATNSEYCITIIRPKQKCAIDGKTEFGANDGENIGRVGAIINPSSSNTSYLWTPVINSAEKVYTESGTSNYSAFFTQNNNKNYWAKPGDNIRFSFEACAGAFYVIENNSSISGGTHYAASGSLIRNYAAAGQTEVFYKRNANGTDNDNTNATEDKSNGFLFIPDNSNSLWATTVAGIAKYREGDSMKNQSYKNPVATTDLTGIKNNTSIPYATWTTGYNGNNKPKSGFLSNESNNIVAQMYGTDAAATPSPSSSHKICGTNAKKCSLGYQEVGSRITQTLSWNYMKITNGESNVGKNNYKTHSATAAVMIPYNYFLKPYVNNGAETSTNVIYLGENRVMTPGVLVMPRENAWVGNNGTTYATITKPTTVEVRAYNLRTNETLYSGTFNNVRFNKDGKLGIGDTSQLIDGDSSFKPEGVTIYAEDNGRNYVGDKICTSITIWPIDSHNTFNDSKVYGAYQSNKNITNMTAMPALTDAYATTGAYKATATSCSTIAKRPTISVESSNAYSATKITTGKYNKAFSDGKKYTFGSWSEYGVFASVNTKDTFVSGAAIGYRTNNPYGNNSLNSPRENNSVNVATSTNSNICTFMTQTFINSVDNKCTPGTNTIGKSSAEEFVNDIIDRYGRKNYGVAAGNSLNSNMNTEEYRIESGNSNSPVVIRADGSTTLSGIPAINATEDNPNPNRTIVYNINGNLNITGNINDQRGANKTSLNDITGVVIIANQVNIDAAVNYINATIIAKTSINTCYSDQGTVISIGTSKEDRGTLNSARCSQTLQFDGPVFAKKVILNRTAGANYGNDSIKRAEIFNLNMATYLWSYYQMTNYSQAITTYSRELPSRY